MATLQRSALRSTTSVRGGARVGAVSAPVRRVAGRRGVAARAEKVSKERTCVRCPPPPPPSTCAAVAFFSFVPNCGFLAASRIALSRRPLFEGCIFDVF